MSAIVKTREPRIHPEELQELGVLQSRFDDACTAGNVDAALALVTDERFIALRSKQIVESASRDVAGGEIKSVRLLAAIRTLNVGQAAGLSLAKARHNRLLRQFDALVERVLVLEQHLADEKAQGGGILKRLEDLEARPPSMRYRGNWNKGGSWSEGDVVTEAGSIWHANRATSVQPGINDVNRDWTLCVRRGQDGKDAPK